MYTFLKLLSRHRDTFIETKFDKDTADYVSSRAGEILSAWEEASGNTESLGNTTRNFAVLLPAVQEFDSELLKKRINPVQQPISS